MVPLLFVVGHQGGRKGMHSPPFFCSCVLPRWKQARHALTIVLLPLPPAVPSANNDAPDHPANPGRLRGAARPPRGGPLPLRVPLRAAHQELQSRRRDDSRGVLRLRGRGHGWAGAQVHPGGSRPGTYKITHGVLFLLVSALLPCFPVVPTACLRLLSPPLPPPEVHGSLVCLVGADFFLA